MKVLSDTFTAPPLGSWPSYAALVSVSLGVGVFRESAASRSTVVGSQCGGVPERVVKVGVGGP